MLIAFRDILRKTARHLGIEPALLLVQVREAWPELVGAALAAAAEPRSLRGGVLLIAAAHPHAAHEIRLRSEEILAGLRRRLPQVDLRRVHAVIRAPAGGEGG